MQKAIIKLSIININDNYIVVNRKFYFFEVIDNYIINLWGRGNCFMSLPNILTAQDIADYLQIGRKKVYELMQITPDSGGIKTFNVGRSRRVERSDFEKWLSQQKSC